MGLGEYGKMSVIEALLQGIRSSVILGFGSQKYQCCCIYFYSTENVDKLVNPAGLSRTYHISAFSQLVLIII